MQGVSPQTEGETDPLRDALAEVLDTANKAHHAVARHEAAIQQTREKVRASETAIVAGEEGIKKAQEEFARGLADAAAADAPTPPSTVRAARQAVADAQDELEAVKGALERLNAGLPDLEHTARQAEIAVQRAISTILAQRAEELLDQAKEVMQQLMPIRDALVKLAARTRQFSDPADYFRDKDEKRPLDQIISEIRLFLAAPNDAECLQQADPWELARQELRNDPEAELPAELTIEGQDSSR
jgi:ABC-type transporter Mla subunit MlaD